MSATVTIGLAIAMGLAASGQKRVERGHWRCNTETMRSGLFLLLALPLVGASPEASSEDAGLRRWLVTHLREEYKDSPNRSRLKYSYALADLNGDMRNEALVYVSGDCGTGGCGLMVVAHDDLCWRVTSETSIGWAPIRLLSTQTHGWQDIGVFVRGGGILPGYEARLRFDGKSYPSNPSVEPAEPAPKEAAGHVLIVTADMPLF